MMKKYLLMFVLVVFLLMMSGCSNKKENLEKQIQSIGSGNNNIESLSGELIDTGDQKDALDFELSFSLIKINNSNYTIVGKSLIPLDFDKVQVVSCKKNYSNDYDEEGFQLKKFKKGDLNVKYNIALKWNNVCNIPYKFKFFSGDQSIEKEYVLPDISIVESVVLTGNKIGTGSKN